MKMIYGSIETYMDWSRAIVWLSGMRVYVKIL
jgi:hypothetical protein